MKKKLIGGSVLRKLGLSRYEKDEYYLVFLENSKEMFIKDKEGETYEIFYRKDKTKKQYV